MNKKLGVYLILFILVCQNVYAVEISIPDLFEVPKFEEESNYFSNFFKKGVAGTLGTLVAVGVVAAIYPERGSPPDDYSSINSIKSTSGDLFKHTFGGGVIATAVGSFTEPKIGLITGVSIGLLKEMKDYFDGDPSSHAQVSDFVVTSAGAFASYLLQDYVDNKVKVTSNSVSLEFDF